MTSMFSMSLTMTFLFSLAIVERGWTFAAATQLQLRLSKAPLCFSRGCSYSLGSPAIFASSRSADLDHRSLSFSAVSSRASAAAVQGTRAALP